jgi:hypothetical protein
MVMPVRLKKRYVIPAIVIIAGVIAFFVLRQRKFRDLEPLVGQQLKALVKAGSDGLYVLQFDSVYTDFTKNNLYLKNIRMRPDSAVLKRKEKDGTLTNDVFLLDIASLRLDNININDLVKGRGINLAKIEIDKPIIQFYHKTRNDGLNGNDDKERSDDNLYQKIRKKAKAVRVKDIRLNAVTFIYCNQNKNNKITKVENVNLYFSDINISSSTQHDESKFLFAKDAGIAMGPFSYLSGDSLYTIQWDSIKLEASKRQMDIAGLHYHPRKSKELTTALSGKNQYDLELKTLSLKNVDWWSLAWEEGFTADSAIMKNGSFSIYNNKADMIRKNKKGNFPHQQLQSADMPILIKNIKIENLDFAYEDFNEKNKAAGVLFLNKISGEGSNLRNLHGPNNTGRYTKLHLNASFMNIAPLHLSLYFDLNNVVNGGFKANIILKNVEGTKLNSITQPLGMLKINSLYVQNVTADIDGDNNGAHANVVFRYNNMNVELLKKTPLGSGTKKRKFFTYIANNVLFKKGNTDQPIEVVHAYYKRTINQSFFGLLWRSLLTGISEAAKRN